MTYRLGVSELAGFDAGEEKPDGIGLALKPGVRCHAVFFFSAPWCEDADLRC